MDSTSGRVDPGGGRPNATPSNGLPDEPPAISAAALARLLPGVLWESDVVDWRATYVSPSSREITGYEASDWVRIREFWEDHLHPDDRPVTMRAVDEAIATGFSDRYDYRWRVADGTYRWFRDRLRVIADDAGRVYMAGMMVDVTPEYEERAERLLVTSERDRLAASIEQSGEVVIVTDPDDLITYVNPAFERTTGFTREEALGRRSRELLDPGPRTAPGGTDAPGDRPWNGEVTARARDGSTVTFISSVVPVRDGAGTVTMVMGVHHDVTHVRRLEAQLAQSAKLEAIGQLAGGVAHDFNNILTAILGYASFVSDALPPDSQVQDDLREISAAGERARRLTAQLLAFGRRSVLRPAAVDVARLVRELAPMVGRLIGEDIRLGLAMPDGPAVAFLDASGLQQSVINLVVNARNAMPDGGDIRVRVDVRAGDGERVPEGDWVVVSVRDTGTGMAPELVGRIFEPFFTTGEFGHGTGLGLAVVDGFVRQSSGHVRVDSAPGEGSTFELWLPAHVPMAAEDAWPVPAFVVAPRARTTALTVLVAEDEAVIRAVVRRGLAGAGHRVLLASSGQEALEVAARFGGIIDVLLSDVVMPGIRGPQLAEELRRTRPGIRVVLASGYTEHDVTRRGIMLGGEVFLSKPYSIDALLAAVEGGTPERPPAVD